MSTEERLEIIEQQNREILSLLKNKDKDEWVGATVITSKTGWKSEDLRKARRNGSIKYKLKKDGRKRTYKYLLSSIVK